jgi:hypothetical protein
VAFYVKCRNNTIYYFENNNLKTDQENCNNFDWFFLKLFDSSLNNYRYEKYLDLLNENHTYCSLHFYTRSALLFFQQREINLCNDNRVQKILWQDSGNILSLVYKNY